MTDSTGDWATKELRIPRTQPFLRDWLAKNKIDASAILPDVRLRLGKLWRLTNDGMACHWSIVIITYPILHLKDQCVVLSGSKPIRGKQVQELIEWPEVVERVSEWDELIANQYEVA